MGDCLGVTGRVGDVVRRRGRVALAVLLAGAGACERAHAAEFEVGDVRLTIKGTISAGTAIRTESPDPSLVPATNGAAAGVAGTAAAGRGQDDGNLNFRRGDAVSTVAKTLIDAEARYDNVGAFVRAIAWRDFALADGDRPWGNLPNGLTPGVPLAESSNRVYGRFTGAALLDANIFGTFDVTERPLFVRTGYQLLPWGVPALIGGGVSALNPSNIPAARRPGALAEESKIPFPAVFARFGLTGSLAVETFYQFAFVRSEIDACGTFFSVSDSTADRCDKVMLGAGLNDRQSIATGNFARRAVDGSVSNAGQFGVGLTYQFEIAQVGAYFAQYHSRAPFVGGIRSGRADPPFIAGDPDGLNPQYFQQYPEDIRLFAFNVVARPLGITLFGELTHRLNQPLQFNSIDLINAFVSTTAATQLRADVDAVPLGGVFPAYERYATTDIQFGASRPLKGILGAATSIVGGEIGVKYVHDLPDPAVRRYGRSEVFGAGPVNGVCGATATALACSSNGFISAFAWGARARVALSYPNLLPNVEFIPSAIFGYDIKGWSYDSAFNEGRNFAVVSLRAEYRKRYAAEISYAPVWGGAYNNVRDRDFVALSVSAKF